jgi:hypothetical protein
MNRRSFLTSLVALTAGSAAVYYGNKFYQVFKTPDINSLDDHLLLIDELAETIIPRTDTPGAKDAKVGLFIVDFVKENVSKKEQNRFVDGLADLEDKCISDYNCSFVELSPEQKIAVLSYFKDSEKNYSGNLGKVNNKLFGRSFFELLKEYTCIGYCTSIEGATKGLAYELVPGKFIANLDYQQNQKSWSTK